MAAVLLKLGRAAELPCGDVTGPQAQWGSKAWHGCLPCFGLMAAFSHAAEQATAGSAEPCCAVLCRHTCKLSPPACSSLLPAGHPVADCPQGHLSTAAATSWLTTVDGDAHNGPQAAAVAMAPTALPLSVDSSSLKQDIFFCQAHTMHQPY